MLQLAIVKKTIKWSYAQITYGSVRKFNHFFLSPRSTGTSTGTGPVPFHTVIELSDGSGAQSHQIAKKIISLHMADKRRDLPVKVACDSCWSIRRE